MVRKNSPNPFANLSDAQIRRLAEQLRDALAPLRDDGADHDHEHQAQAAYGKHIRFERGQMTVMNSARRPSSDSDAAWERLAASAREIQAMRPR